MLITIRFLLTESETRLCPALRQFFKIVYLVSIIVA
jgi:hypothetical protein